MTIEINQGKYTQATERSALSFSGFFRPEEMLQGIDDETFEDFVKGLGVIWQLIELENPEFIIAPSRGSAPLIWGLEVIAEHSGKILPTVANLPIGQNTNLYDYDDIGGLKKNEKVTVFRSFLKTMFEVSQRDKTKFMLLDEAMYGGTISTAAYHIAEQLKLMKQEGFKDAEFVTVAAHDRLHGSTGTAKRFGRLMGNQHGPAHKVTMSMPHIDKSALLPVIIRQPPEVRADEAPYEKTELLEVLENVRAKNAYQARIKRTLGAIHNFDEICRQETINLVHKLD